jgi:hypothetical protein
MPARTGKKRKLLVRHSLVSSSVTKRLFLVPGPASHCGTNRFHRLAVVSRPGGRAGKQGSGRGCASFRLEHPRGRTRVLLKLGRRPRRAREQFTTAVWARPGEAPIRAIAAERALEGTDTGIGRIRRQISVAALTPWAHLEHGGTSESLVGGA